MTQRTLIISFLLFFVASSLFLAFRVERGLDEDFRKDWWAIGFVEPKSPSPNFFIENHSIDTNFVYQVQQANSVLLEETIDVPRGETKTIEVKDVPLTNEMLTITVNPLNKPDTPKKISK